MNIGLPKGYCIGPVLFTTYVSDMTEVKGKYLPETQSYADDYQAYDFRQIHFTNQTDSVIALWPLLLAWINFNPSMDK